MGITANIIDDEKHRHPQRQIGPCAGMLLVNGIELRQDVQPGMLEDRHEFLISRPVRIVRRPYRRAGQIIFQPAVAFEEPEVQCHDIFWNRILTEQFHQPLLKLAVAFPQVQCRQ